MRARNIQPGFYKNEQLAECSVWARLLVPGLWMMADRDGRLEDRPKRIKMEIFPADSIEVEPLLMELSACGHIERYEVGGHKYIQICKFAEHQSPHMRERASSIPPKNELKTSSLQNTKEAGSNQGDVKAQPRQCSAPPDSLIPDSLIASSTEEGAPASGKIPLETQKPPKKPKAYPERFETFWRLYPPNGTSKAEALKSWERALKNGTDGNEIIRAVGAYRSFCDATETPFAHATTWLNQQRWTVDYAALTHNHGNKPRHDSGKAQTGAGKSSWLAEAERLGEKYRAQDG